MDDPRLRSGVKFCCLALLVCRLKKNCYLWSIKKAALDEELLSVSWDYSLINTLSWECVWRGGRPYPPVEPAPRHGFKVTIDPIRLSVSSLEERSQSSVCGRKSGNYRAKVRIN